MRIRQFAFCVALCVAAQLALGLNEMEINNNQGFANGPFTIPDSLYGNFTNDGSPTCSDFFSFSATAGTQYQFYGVVVNGSFLAPLDLGLSVWNSTTELANVDVGLGTVNETLVWTAPSAGTYYVESSEATGTPNGIASYRIDVSVLSSVDNWDLY